MIALLLLVAGCGGGGGEGASSGKTSSDATGSAQPSTVPTLDATWEWAAEDEVDGPSEDDRPAATGSPSVVGEQAGAERQAAAAETWPSEVKDPDPCVLLTTAEWRGVVGASPDKPQALEAGTVCGFRNIDDTRRLAIGVFVAGGAERWLTPEDAAAAQRVDLGATKADAAYWLPQWPVGQSSTLVVQRGAHDLVLELSSRADVADEQHQRDAITLARLALGRVA